MNFSSILNEIEIATEASVIHQLIDNIIAENSLTIRPEMDYEYHANLFNQLKEMIFAEKGACDTVYMLDSVVEILRAAHERLTLI